MPFNPKSKANLVMGRKKGEVRNPGGRSVLEKAVRDALESHDHLKLKAVVIGLVEQAQPHLEERTDKLGHKILVVEPGDTKAADILFDRGYGKVTQPIDTPEGGLVIQVVSNVQNSMEQQKKQIINSASNTNS